MPKLKISEQEQKDRAFVGLLKLKMELEGYSRQQDLAERLNINRSTLSCKINNPDTFTRRELRRLFQVLKFTAEEKARVI